LIEKYGAIRFSAHKGTKRRNRARGARSRYSNSKLVERVRKGLETIQQTVRELLGCNWMPFEPRPRRREVEPPSWTWNDFLIEANGAGIREALRVILDLELKTS